MDEISETLVEECRQTLKRAVQFSFDTIQADGSWSFEVRSNATLTAEYVFLRQALNLDLSADRDSLQRWLLSQQNPDGSWGLAPHCCGDVSTTSEVYLALKILGLPPDFLAMQRAREFTIKVGGMAKVRIFSRLFFAMFGLFPWHAVPQLPAELIMLPSFLPINIYNMSSWARASCIPLLIIRHHEPNYILPNGASTNNDFLDELWCNPSEKNVPYRRSPTELLWKDVDPIAAFFSAGDLLLSYLGGLKHSPIREKARKKCIKWILEHQEETGQLAGVFPPMHGCIFALTLEGLDIEKPAVRRALNGLESLSISDEEGKRLQATTSAVWDTVWMVVALCDAGILKTGMSGTDQSSMKEQKSLMQSVEWIKTQQHHQARGDWRVFRPMLPPGGWSFQSCNSWYPDIDDTAIAIIAILKYNRFAAESNSIIQAIEWVLGMQNTDGGWGAFDYQNDKLFLNKIPFSDMGSLCDPSTADVTGHVIECLAMFASKIQRGKEGGTNWGSLMNLVKRITAACDCALKFLLSKQERSGAWWGRWGCNYIWGTSNVLCGLAELSVQGNSRIESSVARAVHWLKSIQNTDGGWGEVIESYKDPELAGSGPTTPAQTSWALMALLRHLPHSDDAIIRGMQNLVSSIADVSSENKAGGATWPNTRYTSTGFPGHFYIEYVGYPHYFPIIALGRYLQAVETQAR